MTNGFDTFGKSVEDSVERLIGNTVKKTMLQVQNKMKTLQRSMMVYLATSAATIGVESAPTFPGINFGQPVYKPLTPDYLARKPIGVSNDFYRYSGRLQRDLKKTRNNGNNVFGVPTVTYVRRGQGGKTAIYNTVGSRQIEVKIFTAKGNSSTNFVGLKSDLGRISVDLYPELRVLTADKSSLRRITDLFDNDLIGAKFSNYRGRFNRSFLPQYMQWWLRVKAKEALRRAIR
jgi:hypothetical protein